MRTIIAIATSLSLIIGASPASATEFEAKSLEPSSVTYRLEDSAAPMAATEQTPTETRSEDYRLERKKSGAGKKVLKGAAILLGVAAIVVGGLFLYGRARCGPGYERCSE